MSKIIGRAIVITGGGGKAVPSASTTAKSGVTYTDGLSGISAEKMSLYAKAISNNASITNGTSVVYIDDDTNHYQISIGSQIMLMLDDAGYSFDVIGFNHDTLTTANAYGDNTATGKAGITFQMHDCFATPYSMNSSNTNVGGWKNSAMRTSTMATMKNYMSAGGWHTIVKQVNKSSGLGGGSSSGTEIVSDGCFLLSEIEVFGSTTYSVSGEGTQYEYYKAGNSKVKNMGGYTSHWYERSPQSGSSNEFCMVAKNGSASYTNVTLHPGTAFAFCV